MERIMNKNVLIIIISIFVIVSSIVFLILNFEDSKDEKIIIEDKFEKETSSFENKTDSEILSDIEEKYSEIESDVKDNESYTGSYEIRDRIWQNSGPFSIDRYEYALGEKIFVMVQGLEPEESGEILLLRPINQTHYTKWGSYFFDAKLKPSFNIYFEPTISKAKGVCDRDDLLGDWEILFFGTNYENLKFRIFNQTVPGDELKFSKKVC